MEGAGERAGAGVARASHSSQTLYYVVIPSDAAGDLLFSKSKETARAGFHPQPQRFISPRNMLRRERLGHPQRQPLLRRLKVYRRTE
jgi:hypothetical protein